MLTSIVPYQAVDAGEVVRKDKTEYNMPDCIIESDYGTINWTTGLIRAKGISKPVKKGIADIDEDEPIVESAMEVVKETGNDAIVQVTGKKESEATF